MNRPGTRCGAPGGSRCPATGPPARGRPRGCGLLPDGGRGRPPPARGPSWPPRSQPRSGWRPCRGRPREWPPRWRRGRRRGRRRRRTLRKKRRARRWSSSAFGFDSLFAFVVRNVLTGRGNGYPIVTGVQYRRNRILLSLKTGYLPE